MMEGNGRKTNHGKTIPRRMAVAALALALALWPTACGKSGEKKETDDQGKQGVFREMAKTEQLSGLMTGDSNVAAMAYYENILYIVINTYQEGRNAAILHTWDKEGKKLGEAVLFETILAEGDPNAGIQPLGTTQNAYDFRITPQGNVFFTLNETKTGENDETTERNHLKCVDRTGKELFSLDVKSLAEAEETVAVQSVVFSSDGVYVLTGQKIVELDAGGSIVKKYDFPEGYTDLYNPAFYYKGEPVFTIWNYEGESAAVKSLIFDFRSGKVKKELEIPRKILDGYSIYPGTERGYDLILGNSAGLYEYKIGGAEPTPVMNYVASNLPVSGFENLCFVSKTEFVCNYYDTVENKNRIAWMEYVEPDKIPDRQVMTLAMSGPDMNILRKVIDFNKTNSKYKIMVTDYSTYATAEDYNAGVAMLNNEIAAGKVPDMIYNTGSFDFRVYESKGMLADFYELIRADGEMKLEDYAANVFRAFERDRKLYELPHDFCVETMIGKKSIFGNDTSLTWKKLDQVLAQYPDAGAFQNTVTRDQVLNWALRYGMDEFVDQSKGVCHFDSEGFRSLLALASKFPETIDYDRLNADEDAWVLQEQQFILNAALLNPFTISNLKDIKHFTYSSFLEEVTPVGFPNNKGKGSSVYAVGSFGIAEKSSCKQTAWEFVRQFILPDAQMRKDSDDRYGLPVYKPALLEMASHMTEKPFYIDAVNGEKVYYDNIVVINGQEIVVEPASKQEASGWVDFILSVDQRVSKTADALLKIVNEEAAAYFDGQKSVEDVTRVIQSRISIYISENS